MDNKIKIGYPAIIFLTLVLLFALNFIAAYSESPLLLNASKVVFVPFILMIFFIKHKTLSLIFIAFLLFSFFGDSTSWFLSSDSVANGSNIMYLISYLILIVMAIPYFKPVKIDKIIGIYLLVILSINGYFLFTICDMLRNLITDSTEMILFGTKSMALLLLVFISFTVYLSTQTKASILFLIMAISFAFSDALNYVTHYYIYNWSILLMDRLLHITGLIFAFTYIIEINKVSEKTYANTSVVKDGIFSRNISWLK
jgi:hypothetical protein